MSHTWINPFLVKCNVCGNKSDALHGIIHALDCPNGKIPCRFCSTPTRMLATKMCDNCHAVHSRILYMPGHVLQAILKDARK